MSTLIPSTSLNALRWGFLAFGVYWGYSRHASLSSFVLHRTQNEEKLHNEELIQEAKIAFEAQYNREQSILAKAQGVDAIDANSYRFNAEKWINFALSQSEK